MKKLLTIIFCLAGLSIFPALVVAGENGIGFKASTLGAGFEYERNFSDNFGMRFGVNYFQFDSDFTAGDIHYDSSVDLQSASGLIDWYPMSGAFRVSGGVFYNGNEATFTSTPATPVTIGEMVYPPGLVGTLNGKVTFNTAAPYLGIGWSSGRENREGLSIAFDLGVLFQGDPDIEEYYATGPLAGNPKFQAELEREVALIEDELEPYKYYPVVSLTLTYRF